MNIKLSSPSIIILGGLPASGKSTLAHQLADKLNFSIICKDSIRLYLAQFKYGKLPENILNDKLYKFSKYIIPIVEICTNFFFSTDNSINNLLTIFPVSFQPIIANYILSLNLKHSSGIIYDATHFNKQQRKKIINLVNNRLPIYCLYFVRSLDEAKINCEWRANQQIQFNNQFYSNKSIPIKILEQMKKFESIPKIEEGFEKVYLL